MSPAAKPLPVGTRHGRLVVTVPRAPGEKRVQCVCDCGTPRSVPLSEWGKTQSCGCLRREVTAERSTRHGHTAGETSSLYYTWADMVGRCTRPTHKRWADYGGRGITVCDRWLDFTLFLADMGDRPGDLTLDRIDNNRGYEPGNCRWATYQEQRANRRPVKLRTHCKRDHELTPENTITSREGKRRCRTCQRDWQRSSKRKKHAE